MHKGTARRNGDGGIDLINSVDVGQYHRCRGSRYDGWQLCGAHVRWWNSDRLDGTGGGRIENGQRNFRYLCITQCDCRTDIDVEAEPCSSYTVGPALATFHAGTDLLSDACVAFVGVTEFVDH